MAKSRIKYQLIRSDWDNIKFKMMLDIVSIKFLVNKDLAKLLLSTGDKELIEGNYWRDTYWGVYNGIGKNLLGKILMKVRSDLSISTKIHF